MRRETRPPDPDRERDCEAIAYVVELIHARRHRDARAAQEARRELERRGILIEFGAPAQEVVHVR